MFFLTGHTNLLSEEKLDEIHEAAVNLAEDVGLLVAHDVLLTRLANYEGVTIVGERVYFRSDCIEAALKSMRFPPTPDPERFYSICGAYIINILDLETEQIRSTSQQDLVELTILGEQLGLVGSPVVRPLDVPEELQEIAMYKTTWEYSANRPELLFDTTPISTVFTAETIYEMAQEIGKSFSVGMYLISPFKCPPEGMDVIAAFLDRDVPMWIGTMPIAGLNAPIFMFGAHIQALAELMAGITLLHVLTEDKVPIYWTPIDSVRAHPFDMRKLAFVYGSPEDMIGTILQAQINNRYGVPFVAKSLLSTARDPDEQTAAEKCAHTLLAALCGARIFTNAGFLANDEYISPAQVVIDNEIVEHVRHVIEGLRFDKKEMALSAIREVIQDGSNFIEHETTIQNYRSAAWDPSLFSHIMAKASGEKPVPSVWERAREQARKHIRAGDFVIPDADRKILDSIYRRVEEQVIQ